MSERWKPKQVARMVTPEVRAAAQQREADRQRREADRQRLVEQHQQQRRVVNGQMKIVLCMHNVNWLTCKLCSHMVK